LKNHKNSPEDGGLPKRKEQIRKEVTDKTG